VVSSATLRLRGNRQVGRQQRLLVDLDQQRVFTRLRKRQIADFVDQIDPVQGALRFERALQQGLWIRGVEAHRDPQLVLAGRAIADGEKPDHERVRDGKLTRLDVGKNPQDRVLAGTGIDVNAIARQPGEELRFGMHDSSRAGPTARSK
jgi:hypothetical protein